MCILAQWISRSSPVWSFIWCTTPWSWPWIESVRRRSLATHGGDDRKGGGEHNDRIKQTSRICRWNCQSYCGCCGAGCQSMIVCLVESSFIKRYWICLEWRLRIIKPQMIGVSINFKWLVIWHDEQHSVGVKVGRILVWNWFIGDFRIP